MRYILMALAIMLLTGYTLGMRRVERWNQAKFKRARELIKLQEFAEKLRKLRAKREREK